MKDPAYFRMVALFFLSIALVALSFGLLLAGILESWRKKRLSQLRTLLKKLDDPAGCQNALAVARDIEGIISGDQRLMVSVGLADSADAYARAARALTQYLRRMETARSAVEAEFLALDPLILRRALSLAEAEEKEGHRMSLINMKPVMDAAEADLSEIEQIALNLRKGASTSVGLFSAHV